MFIDSNRNRDVILQQRISHFILFFHAKCFAVKLPLLKWQGWSYVLGVEIVDLVFFRGRLTESKVSQINFDILSILKVSMPYDLDLFA